MVLRPTGIAATAIAAVTAVLTLPRIPSALTALNGDNFPQAIEALALLICAVVSLWLLLVVAAGCARWSLPGVPRAVRASLFTGVAIAAMGVAPASAETQHDLDGLPLPDRPTVTSADPASSRETPPVTDRVTVKQGDSLWQIAADHAPRDASVADVAAATRAWHRANRAEIGADPNLLHPGQPLVAPTGANGKDQS